MNILFGLCLIRLSCNSEPRSNTRHDFPPHHHTHPIRIPEPKRIIHPFRHIGDSDVVVPFSYILNNVGVASNNAKDNSRDPSSVRYDWDSVRRIVAANMGQKQPKWRGEESSFQPASPKSEKLRDCSDTSWNICPRGEKCSHETMGSFCVPKDKALYINRSQTKAKDSTLAPGYQDHNYPTQRQWQHNMRQPQQRWNMEQITHWQWTRSFV